MLTKADATGMMRAVSDFVRRQMDTALAGLNERLAAVETRQPEKGEPGKDGVDGAPGRDGEPGAPGRDGKDGIDGIPGKDGADGLNGEQGPPGRDGLPGKDGEPGASGRDGKDGLDGKDGAPGLDGRDGEPGTPGRDGKLPLVRAWTDQVWYEGDVVTFDGRTYQAQRDTGKAPHHSDWICLAERGTDGANGQGFTIRGTYDPEGSYDALDVVALNGASFAARQDNPGPCPGEGWQLLAAQGKRGKEGEPGRRGEPGPPGPSVVAMAINGEGLLTLTNGDGSQVNCDLYPLLIRLAK